MKNNLWIVAIVVVAVAAVLLGVWQMMGLGQADNVTVALGAVGWLALALVGFGTLAATDPFSHRA